MGLIPRPETRTHRSGRGQTGYWPEWVVDRCQQIRRLQEDGLTLADIAQRLGSDWAAEERAWEARQKSHLVANSARPSKQQVALLVGALQHALMEHATTQSDQMIHRSNGQYEPRDLAPQAIEMAFRGFRPILVVVESGSYVVAEFAVGITERCTDAKSDLKPRLIFPLYPVLRKVLGDVFPALQNIPRWTIDRDFRITTPEGDSRRIRILQDGQFEELPDAGSPTSTVENGGGNLIGTES